MQAKDTTEMGEANELGLIIGLAYSVTDVQKVALAGTGINRDNLAIIRLRNPWGGTEWKGEFSDG